MTRGGWAAAFALLFAASFPFRMGELRFDLGLVCGWLALVPLALLLRGLRPRAAFAWSAGAATLGFAGIVFWLYVVVAVHGQANPVFAVLAVLGMAVLNGLHVGAAGAATAALAPRAGPLAFAVLPAAWVAAEQVRGHILFGGFPWAFLGYSAHENGPALALASIGGVYGLSLLMAVFASLLVRRRVVAALGLLAAAHAAGFALGVAELGSAEPSGAGDTGHRVGIVQGNIPQSLKWDPEFANESFQRHLDASRLAAATGPLDLIVWPEAAATVPVQSEPWRGFLAELARETGASLLVGSTAIERIGPGNEMSDFRFFNSVFVLTPDGSFVDRYDKARLVPFGEYLPLRPFLGLFIEALARGAAIADITPGPGPRALVHLPGYESADAPTALICYEVIYPGLVREAVRSGARVLVNVTNDAWYGRTSAPHQFLAIAAMRSAEHGLPMIRAANTGVSALVAPGGRVLQQTPIFEAQTLVVRLPTARDGVTLYTRFGDWVVWGCWLFLAAIGGWSLVGNRRSQRDAGAAGGSRGADTRAAEASLTSKRRASG